MRVVKDFSDNAGMDFIVAEMTKQGAVLVETQNHSDGNHLIFEVPDRDLATEIDNLKTRIEKLEKK